MLTTELLTGSIVALVTPMKADKSIDLDGFKQLVEWHKHEGTDGIVIAGTTGEAPALESSEVFQMVAAALEIAAGEMKVIVGNGGIATDKVIATTKSFKDYPIDGFLTCTPYYVKPTQAGMIDHFKAVADNAHRPICLYNVPGRTGVDLSNESVVTLAAHENINSLKDATGELARAKELITLTHGQLALLSGDDETSLEFLKLGGHGVISVTANIVPKLMAQRGKLVESGQVDAANEIEDKIKALHSLLFIEPNPIPVKWALNRMKKTQNELRLPMTPLAVQSNELDTVMRQLQLIA